MKNKVLARIAASAISVAMLGTAVFAAETGAMPSINDVEGDETTKVLSFIVGEENIIKPSTEVDQVTMMSYLVSADATYANCDYVDEATTPMIALDQVAYADSFASGVKVAADKLDATKQIVVKRGASDGSTDKWIFALAADGKTVTFMNGTTATPVKAADGKVTLPTAEETSFWGTPASGYVFTLYSWVALDESGNVVAEYKVSDTTEIEVSEDVTLYAKYDTGYKVGMVNADANVNSTDTTLLRLYTLRGTKNAANKNVGAPLYEGSSTLIGNINNDANVNSTDTTLLSLYTLRGTLNNANKNIGKKVYIVNDKDVLADE